MEKPKRNKMMLGNKKHGNKKKKMMMLGGRTKIGRINMMMLGGRKKKMKRENKIRKKKKKEEDEELQLDPFLDENSKFNKLLRICTAQVMANMRPSRPSDDDEPHDLNPYKNVIFNDPDYLRYGPSSCDYLPLPTLYPDDSMDEAEFDLEFQSHGSWADDDDDDDDVSSF